ncbi:Altered inheritance of mitochondria protein 6 [Aspergillus nanangensis]|uniref:Altered inheritance of mitochondria protein 6 n=1 Tax=Aspergillus nanangensis TaxID=2582783 RepID=A0AAD4CVY1_ASPNN|nr:Altered inheritance of mitochondria protein 6 [Aspergillus nanangensis]
MATSNAGSTHCRTQLHHPQQQQKSFLEISDYDAYSSVLLDDHPLRSHPTDYGPHVAAFLSRCYAAVKRRWTERLFPIVCVLLMFFMLIQFLASLPYSVSYLLLRNELDEQMGGVQWPLEFGDRPGSTCLAYNPLAHDGPVQYAVDAGCTGVKADVWMASNEADLLVGRSKATAGTLTDVYLRTLLETLDAQNPEEHPAPSGLFQRDATRSFVLLLEPHAPIHTVWPRLAELLTPLHQRGYLSYRTTDDSAELVSRPVTVVLVGDHVASLEAVQIQHPGPDGLDRSVFLDIIPPRQMPPPVEEDHGSASPTDHSASSLLPFPESVPEHTYAATTNFTQTIGAPHRGRFSPQQINRIRAQVQVAHTHGLQARYTGIPCHSGRLRRMVWRILVHEGADMIDVDWSGCEGRGWRRTFFMFGGVSGQT